MHVHHWTERQLYADNAPDAVDDLRWAMYASLLSDDATMHLEQQVEELDHADQLENAPNATVEKGLRKTWRAQARLRINELFRARTAARATLLLSPKERSVG